MLTSIIFIDECVFFIYRCPVIYEGDRCEINNEDDKTGLIVGVSIGLIVLIILLLICLKRKLFLLC